MRRVIFVCHGNICRSPMAEFVMRHLVTEAGITDIEVSSAAASSEAVGQDMHPDAKRVLDSVGVPYTKRRARRFTSEDYENCDVIAVMDSWNLRDIRTMTDGDPDGKVALLMSFAGDPQGIDDPWYTGNFQRAYRDITAGCRGLLAHLEERR